MKYAYEKDASIKDVLSELETLWINPYKLPFQAIDGLSQLAVSDEDIDDAEQRLKRFAPFINNHICDDFSNSVSQYD